jgi:type II secretion system protein D
VDTLPDEILEEVPLDEDELASATVGTAEQNALTINVDPRTNSLLVGGTDHYVELVSSIIQELDSSEAQERRSEVYRLRNAQAQDIANAIRSFLEMERTRIQQVLGAEAVGTAQRMLEREVAIVAEPVSNTLLLSANPRYFEQIIDLVTRLDQPQPQVLIQVLLAEVTLDDSTDLGIEWSYRFRWNGDDYGVGTILGVSKELAAAGGGYASVLTGSDYNFLLRALKTSGRLEVLSRPQILTADNKPASINIGQRVPLITNTRITDQDTTINSFQYESVGVALTVTPRIGSEGLVQMEIATTNSAVSSSSVSLGSSGTIPILNERRANTSVSVQSGQSIIIGGLISTSDDTRTVKVPVLGDIPYLGVLFRKHTKIADRKELLILLTPQVLLQGDESFVPTTPAAMTREQLNRSQLKEQFKQDNFRKQLIRPLFPEDEPAPNGNSTNSVTIPLPSEPQRKPEPTT